MGLAQLKGLRSNIGRGDFRASPPRNARTLMLWRHYGKTIDGRVNLAARTGSITCFISRKLCWRNMIRSLD